MCVALPGRIIEILDRANAIVRVLIGQRTHDVSAAIIADEELEVGDWLEIHMGHALAKLSEDEASELLGAFEELDAAHRRAVEALLETDGPSERAEE